ncbi:hypothetical protein ABMA28_001433 [Loxostege sticticalis]|uniref:FLYWCH-type domain-containing protein n=1 Tax=Loxostege sticticalis TaxID=481309 RepID=A0ABD0T1Y4_LOXSC
MLVDGYKYSCKDTRTVGKLSKRRWHCSTHNARGCRAVINTIGDEEYEIIKMNREHSHEGKRLLLIDGFRFAKEKQFTNGKIRWHCSTHHNHHTRCKAFVHTFFDEILRLNNNHTHDTPKRTWTKPM